MFVERTTVLPAPMERCLAELERPDLLRHVSAPMLTYRTVDPPEFPVRWSEASYLVTLLLGGKIPIGNQTIGIEFIGRTDTEVVLRDNGHSDLIKTWDHYMILEAAGDLARYTDRVEVKAGLLTPAVWMFAWAFYRHRHRRWVALVTNDFAYR